MGRRSSKGFRDFPGRRWLIVVLRGLHVAGVVGCGAGLLGAPLPPGGVFAGLLLCGGLGMALLDAWSNPVWLKEYAGLAFVFKLVLLCLLVVWESQRLALFWMLLGYSVLVSHAPASFRHQRIGDAAVPEKL